MSSQLSPLPRQINTALYARTSNFTFDLTYYFNTHVPLVHNYWKPHGLIDAYIAEASPDSQFAYVVTMIWKDGESWEHAKGQEKEMTEIQADVGNFTNGVPEFVEGRIVSSQR
jgi:hypothetical protein